MTLVMNNASDFSEIGRGRHWEKSIKTAEDDARILEFHANPNRATSSIIIKMCNIYCIIYCYIIVILLHKASHC